MPIDANKIVTADNQNERAIIVPRENEDPLELLRRCGGYYRCPKDKSGYRLGKLVVYAGKYDDPPLNFVGDVYANGAVMRDHVTANGYFAERLACKLAPFLGNVEVICGVPTGGVFLGTLLGLACNKKFVPLVKRITSSPEAAKEEYILELASGAISPGDGVILVEDIVNNATNTHAAVEVVEEAGGVVVLLACFLNRSVVFDDQVPLAGTGKTLQVVSLVRKSIPQYRQDDPAVIDDMRRGNVCWHVKKEWGELMESMQHDELGE